LLDWTYRLLGLVVQARFQVALLVAVVTTVFLLVEIQLALDHAAGLGPLAILDSPLLLVLAVWLVAQLPPGVVFRATGAPPVVSAPAPPADEDEQDGRWGCRASGWFHAGSHTEWRLLAQSTLQVTEWGRIELRAPNPVARSSQPTLAPLSVRTMDWYRPFGARPPLWGSDHLAVQWQRRRRREPEPRPEPTSHLTIPAHARQAIVVGWQYAGLRRYPALRMAHQGEDGREQLTYLAFGSVFARDAVLARLLDHPSER
jgi:hypothetical protein